MDIAQKSFEIANDVETIDANDAIFKYDKAEQMTLLDDPPWAKDPHWFKEVKISAVALIKMVIHARSGGQYEIMGLMNGKIHNQTFYVLDSFALPVQGTETRVNAGDAAMEYMVQFTGGNEEIGKQELVVGWYHSHPGYGCWLSGIDVNTQAVQQKHNDPYLAVVIDPNRTVSAGKVEIGAFRTYPEGYTPPDSKSSDYQSIPLDKIEDFGVHANSYYPLKVSVFKSSLDAKLLESLWNKYWVNTLSQSTIISSRPYASSQLKDLTAKLSQAESRISKDRHAESMTITRKIGKSNNGEEDVGVKWEEKETALRKVSKDGQRISAEAQNGILAQEFKSTLFNRNLKFESSLPAQPRVPSDPTASAQALDPASSADPISLSQSETPQPA